MAAFPIPLAAGRKRRISPECELLRGASSLPRLPLERARQKATASQSPRHAASWRRTWRAGSTMSTESAGSPWRHTVEETRYGLRIEIPLGYDRAVEHATAAINAQGFGVLTTIDVQQTLKQKLDREFRRYVILGACNPALADRALRAELDVGLLLPCNVIVYEVSPDRSVVSAMA